MKNILLKIALVVVLLLCAAALASCGANTDDPYAPPTGMISATDEKADFCLFVPDEWQIDYSTAAAGAYYSASDPSSVSVLAWDLDYTDTSVDEWWQTNVNEVGVVFDNINVESEENITMSEVYGKKYIYTFVFGEGNGGYDGGADPDDPSPSEEPVLTPITYTVTVDDFQKGYDEDVEMKF